MAKSGIVRYEGYKGSTGGGMKNKRKKKIARQRNEEAIELRLQKQAEEKAKLLVKSQYAKEAKEWSERYEY